MILLLFTNLIVLIGVLFFNWSLIELILTYYYDTVIILVFNVVKIPFAKGIPPHPNTIDTFKLSRVCETIEPSYEKDKPLRLETRIVLAMYLGLFLCWFAFIEYWALEVNKSTISNTLWWYLPVLAMIVAQTLDFVVNYIGKKDYENTSIIELTTFVYYRLFILHISILLGAFIMVFISIDEILLHVLLFALLRFIIDIKYLSIVYRCREIRFKLTINPASTE